MTWRCSTVFFKIVLWASGCPYTVQGLENLDPDANYFFACNHESLWDVPLVFAVTPFWLISIAKKSLRLVPVFGWAVAAGGTVWIDRKNHEADMKSMQTAEQSLRKRPRSRPQPSSHTRPRPCLQRQRTRLLPTNLPHPTMLHIHPHVNPFNVSAQPGGAVDIDTHTDTDSCTERRRRAIREVPRRGASTCRH